jgi:hypothetical protein
VPLGAVVRSHDGATDGEEDPMAKDHGPSIKNDEQYESLREEGHSKEAAARIANSGEESSKKGGSNPSYDEWSVDDLRERASELDVEGRSDMNKDELIEALRNR